VHLLGLAIAAEKVNALLGVPLVSPEEIEQLNSLITRFDPTTDPRDIPGHVVPLWKEGMAELKEVRKK